MYSVKNFAATTISTVSLSAASPIVAVTTVGNLLPSTACPYIAVIYKSTYTNATAAALAAAALEIIEVTNVSGSNLTITRAMEGTGVTPSTTGYAFSSGDYIICPITAGIIQEIDTSLASIIASVALKAPAASPTFTGTVTLPVTGSGVPTMNGAGAVNAASLAYTNNNTINTLVSRDGSGNFSAGTITAALTGNVTGNVTGTATDAGLVGTSAGTVNGYDHVKFIYDPVTDQIQLMFCTGAGAIQTPPSYAVVQLVANGHAAP